MDCKTKVKKWIDLTRVEPTASDTYQAPFILY